MELKLIELKNAVDPKSCGNKAAGLAALTRAGFRVPPGWVIPREAVEALLDQQGLLEPIRNALSGLTPDTVDDVANRLEQLSRNLMLSEPERQSIRDALGGEGSWAVRSSGTLEDLAEASFAGQYQTWLNVSVSAVSDRVLDCIRSLWRRPVLTYLLHQGLDPAKASLAVLIQEMVPADLAGVMFTVNPNTGADTEVVIEAVRGLGDALVSGQATPQTFTCDWYRDKISLPAAESLLSRGQVRVLARAALKIQRLFGHPVDVEFAVVGGRNYALQTRSVTKIRYAGLSDQWTTADLKDGGVSATVSKPLMLSLYQYVWDTQLKDFLLESRILRPKELRGLSLVRFGRMYWNLSVVKAAMAKVPGYRERAFDEELGIEPTYAGEGAVTDWSPGRAANLLSMALAQKQILKKRLSQNETLKQELLTGYDSFRRELADLSGNDLKAAWIRLVRDLYLKSEGIYFRQIFINTIQISLQRDAILKHTDQAGYYDLIGGLTNVSHLRPFYDLWDVSRQILGSESAVRYWQDHSPEELSAALRSGASENGLDQLRTVWERYGYHSDRELDISWPDFAEDPASLIASLRDALALPDESGPEAAKRRVHLQYLDALDGVGRTKGSAVRQKVSQKVERIRQLLWWREEFRDISTRYYHLIRQTSRKLGDLLVQDGILEQASDLWFLTMTQILALLEEKLSPEQVRDAVRRGRDYTESFRSYASDNEIGEGASVSHPLPTGAGWNEAVLTGLPASGGRIRGRARVIAGLEDIDRIAPGDLLVTRFTDTGWTSKFALLSGVITEYGGALCHAAIVSREYGIPCIVGVRGAMEAIRDGDWITMDGATGTIYREESL